MKISTAFTQTFVTTVVLPFTLGGSNPHLHTFV